MTKKDLEDKKMKTLTLANAWKCRSCGKVLGYTDLSKETLRIKYKDLYVYIRGGEVTEICIGCGESNHVRSS